MLFRKRRQPAQPDKGFGPGGDPTDSDDDIFAEFDELSGLSAKASGRGDGGSTGSAGGLTLSRRGLSLSILGLACLLIWVFILGVLVGRGAIFDFPAFKRLESHLPEPGGDLPPPEVEVSPPPGAEQNPEDAPKLTFYEDLGRSRNKKEVLDLPPPPPPRPAKPAQPEAAPAKPQPQPEPQPEPRPEPGADTPAQRPVENPAGVKTVEAHKSDAPPPARRPGENFTVQVAAARTAPDADRAVARLKALGFDAYFYQVELKGRRYYRIRVGRFPEREQAQQELKKLEAKGYSQMFVSALID